MIAYALGAVRGVVGSTLAFGSIGHGFESEHRLFSHHGASAFSKLRSLITGEVLTGRFSSSTAVVHSASYPPGEGESSSSIPVVVLRGQHSGAALPTYR